MELYHLKSFIAVSNHKNLTKAANYLNLSPSALSSQIKALEEDLGVDLFVRIPKGMRMTDVGRELYVHARQIVKAASKLRERARVIGRKHSEILKIGINLDPDMLEISSLNKTFSEVLPDVTISYVKNSTLETARMLRRNMINIGFVFGNSIAKDVEVKLLSMMDINVVIPNTMFDRKQALDWNDIAQLPWIWGDERCPYHQTFQVLIDKRGLSINKVGYTIDDKITKQLVKDGKGVALIMCNEARELENAKQAYIWRKGTVKIPFGVAYLTKQRSSPLIKLALSSIIEIWGQKIALRNLC